MTLNTIISSNIIQIFQKLWDGKFFWYLVYMYTDFWTRTQGTDIIGDIRSIQDFPWISFLVISLHKSCQDQNCSNQKISLPSLFGCFNSEKIPRCLLPLISWGSAAQPRIWMRTFINISTEQQTWQQTKLQQLLRFVFGFAQLE